MTFADSLTQVQNFAASAGLKTNIVENPGSGTTVPPVTTPTSGTDSPPTPTGATTTVAPSGGPCTGVAAYLNPFCWFAGSTSDTSFVGSQLLRFVMLILGLICVVGAIYLFKDSVPIIGVPVNAVKKGVGHLKSYASKAVVAGAELG